MSHAHFHNLWRRAQRARKVQRGTVATEFALCVPLLLLMGIGCADFGRIAHFNEILCNAARTGAEHGATHKFTSYTQSDWEAGIQEAVLREMQNVPEFQAGDLSYDLTTSVDADGLARIGVSVAYPFRTLVNWPGLPHEVMLRKDVEFRQFR